MTRKEEVLRSLRAAILSGEIAPGETLNEVTLSRQFGVSVTPVREAVLALIGEGLATREPNLRARVVYMTSVEVVELLDATGLLIGAVVRRAQDALDAETGAQAAYSLRECADLMETGDRDRSDAALSTAMELLMSASRNGELNALLRGFLGHTAARLRLVPFAPMAHSWAAAFRHTAQLIERNEMDEAAEALEAGFEECIRWFESPTDTRRADRTKSIDIGGPAS